MSLKTNSKKAAENIKKYIVKNFDGTNYGVRLDGWQNISKFVYNCFLSEKWNSKKEREYFKNNERMAFVDWLSGLPSVLDSCYYYNRSAVNDLSAILEQNQIEKNKHTESDAEALLSYLIYREIKKEVDA